MKKKKRLLSLFIIFCMVFTLMPISAMAATAENHAIKLELVKDNTTFEGKEVLRVDFMYKSGTDTPQDQAVYLKYNADALTPLAINGNDGTSLCTNFSENNADSFVTNAYSFKNAAEIAQKSEVVFYTIIKEKQGYICWKVTEKNGVKPFVDFTKIGTIFFGLKENVAFNQLQKDVIRLATVTEDKDVTSQTVSIEITTNGSESLKYGQGTTENDNLVVDLANLFVAGSGVTFALPALTGNATIEGDAKIDVQLTAKTSDLPSDAGDLSYQWYRGNGNEWALISEETASTYTPSTADDVGKKIKVKVSAANYSGEIESTPTSEVAKGAAPVAPTGLAEVSKTDTTITVTPNSAWEYSRDNGGTWQSENTFTGLAPNTEYKQIVARVKETDTHAASAACAAISVTTAKASVDETLHNTLINAIIPYSKEYDAADHPALTVGNLPKGWTAAYSNTQDGTYNTDIPMVKNVSDSKTVWVKFTNTAYADVTNGYEVKVTPKALTITAKPKTITYGQAPDNDGVSYSAFAGSEGAKDLTGTLTYDYNYMQYDDVGTAYTITPKGYTADNYAISFVAGTLTVEPKEVGLTWNNAEDRKYGDNKTVTATATDVVNSDAITVTVNGGDATSVGPHTATAVKLEGTKAGNYKLPEDTNVIEKAYTIDKADAPAAPTVTGSYAVSATDPTKFVYTVKAIEGAEYSKDGNTYQASNVFDEIAPNAQVTFYARMKETENVHAGEAGNTGSVTFNKLHNENEPVLNYTISGESGSYTIEIAEVEGAEYQFNTEGWKAERTKTLSSNTKVTLQIRYKETATLTESKAVTIEVDTAKKVQTVTFDNNAVSKTYTDADFTVAAANSAKDGGNIKYSSSNTNIAVVDETTGKVTIKGHGTVTIKAYAEENDAYAASAETAYTLTIAKATITIKAKNKQAYVGDKNAPVLGTDDYEVSGLRDGEQLATLPTIAYETEPKLDAAGTAVIKVSGAAAPAGDNYNEIVYVNGTLTVSTKPSSSGSSGGYYPYTPTTPSKPSASGLDSAKKDSNAALSAAVAGNKYDAAEQAEVKKIMDKAAADIKNAKTEAEVKAIQEAAEKELDQILTTEEKEIIAAVESVEKSDFKAKSKVIKRNGKKAIKLTWNVPEDVQFDGFEIYRSTKKNSGYGKLPFFTTTKTNYTNTKNLKAGKTYYYKVRAFVVINGEKVYTEYSLKAWRKA